MVAITRTVYDEMIAHALACAPEEACGLFASDPKTKTVTLFLPITNVAHSEMIYEIDGAEYLEAERKADDAGQLVVGVMHSHTHTTNYPSPTDIADAANFDPFGSWSFIIVSIKHPEPSMRSYRILDGEVTEETVQFRSE